MSVLKKILNAAVITVMAVGVAKTAAASTVTISQQNAANIFAKSNGADAWRVDQNVTYLNKNGVGSTTATYAAGLFRLKADGVDFLAWCVDLFQTITLPAAYTVDDYLFSGQTRTRLDALISNASVTNSNTASAFQLAVWEIITDSTLNLLAGDFKANSSNTARTTAIGWLNNITSGTWKSTGTEFTFLKSDTNQDLVAIGLGGPTPVPVPAAIWMIGTGVAALVAAGRRRRTA